MPSESSNAAWHPAFMPNSAADKITSKSIPASSIIPTTEPELEKLYHGEAVEGGEWLSSDNGVYEHDEDILNAREETPENNTEHPELNNLRTALQTSLASPGGVEMDEIPAHNGISKHDTIHDERADFPSVGPTNESKHFSTSSFARTVSEEVNWGEDDEVDSEWNLHRTNTDPFKAMPKSDRTNSYPQVPANHNPLEEQFDFPIAHSQAEDIMNGIEQTPCEMFSGDDGNGGEADFFAQNLSAQDSTVESTQSRVFEAEHISSNDYGQAYGGDIGRDEESQARYEEGLPLVQSEEPSAEQEPIANSTTFEDDEEDDFFSQVSKPAKPEESSPPALERKSTVQVMNALHFQPHEQTHNGTSNIERRQSSFERATGGGIGASTSTILSEVLGNPTPRVIEEVDQAAPLQTGSSEDDLAAKWQAALAADEFLDDEDELLLDDDEGENKPVDPASFFGDDDEGFLEDTEVQQQASISQQFSPALTAVKSPNGHVVGFEGLSRGVSERPSSSSSRYLPTGAATMASAQPANSYTPAAPLLTDFSNPTQASYTASPPAMNYQFQQPQQQPQRPELPKAQSFANKAKGGYHSPYDLPMEVKPRKRVSTGHMARGYNTSAPTNNAPPRSSSIHALPPPSQASHASLSPPTSSHSYQASQLQQPATNVPPSGPPSQKPKSTPTHGFFEDLPIVTKPKPAVRHSAGPASPSTFQGPPTSHPPQPTQTSGGYFPFPPPPVQPPAQPSIHPQGLVAPERVSPYAPLPTGQAPVPATASRYSPAPPLNHAHTAPPVAQNRYSPAPPPAQTRPQIPSSYVPPPMQQPPVSLPHMPRTSSPLAHFVEKPQDSRSHGSNADHPTFDRRSSSSGYEPSLRAHPLPPTREVDENEGLSPPSSAVYNEPSRPHAPQYSSQSLPRPPPNSRSITQTPPPSGHGAKVRSPSKRASSSYVPQQNNTAPVPPQPFVPPPRAQTQSPGSAFAGPRLEMSASDPYQRPASVQASSPRATTYSYASMPTPNGRPRGFSQNVNYIAPVDGRENDPLQRWRGSPVFAWGVGGTMVTSFPKDVPRYGMNQTSPMIIRSPGEVKIRNIKEIDSLEQRITSFPGPLKGKAKKKEVIIWLSSGIEMLEQSASYLRTLPILSHEDKRTEERLLLWKILRVFIENDGVLEGNPVVDKAVRAVLSPGLDDEVLQTAPLYATGADLSGISQSAASVTRADPVDVAAVDQLRKHLLRGEREKAVWEAVDKRLWAHAMLIANTLSKDLYKQVAQEFVQKEVKNIGDNTESLAVLYEIFAGNFEESIDELVPPSARAGFQMVSTSNASGASKDALDGLDRWRETLGLVLSNRSADDSQALTALGKLLSGYGRAEAAHICFLFARSTSNFSGIDDLLANMVLLGSDHLRQPQTFDRELEPVLLSEVYEYGLSLSTTSNVPVFAPHLAIYKLQHATILTEYGHRDKALQYCETIATSITSQTRRSPYHHTFLVSSLDDLSKRLKQSPKDENSSWISKPSIDKVSSSVWDTFNKFVAGDDKDNKSGSSSGSNVEIGPFARIAGGTPTISRSPSNADIYGSYTGAPTANGINGPLATIASSRYAPGGSYTPPSTSYEPQTVSPYGSQPRSSLEERRSSEYRRPNERQMSDYRPSSQLSNQAPSYPPQANSLYQAQPSYGSYGGTDSPYGDNSSSYAPEVSTPSSDPALLYESPQSLNNFDGQPTNSFGGPDPLYQSPESAYTPPTSSGYEPPTNGYTPYEPGAISDEPDSPIETRPKKKTFMDDDEDDIPALRQAPDNREKTKAEKDREADEAFRKAAEADAKKDAPAPAKKGWGLGGWFGGGKKEAAQDMSQTNKPIRAKLGEASSFVYDPDLKRWVNKKAGGESVATPSATPPPPKGPPRPQSGPPTGPLGRGGPTSMPRSVSAAAGLPQQRSFSSSSDRGSSPLARADGEIGDAGGLAPPPLLMTRSQSNGPPSAPPSRPGTGMSNASSIDDLLGPPSTGSRKGTVKRAKKGRGYIDVMGEKAG